jgi:regulator of replication initiation timing
MMSRACAALSDLDFSSDDSSSSEEDERPKRKTDDFTDLCLMGKSSWHTSDSDSDVSDDSSPEGLSLRVAELENALCNQDKLLGKFFRENKKLNLELESSFSEIASLQSAHDDMSAKPCDRCTMIMVNYVDLWLIHSHVAGVFNSVRLELREIKAHSTLLGVCTSCLVLKSDLEVAAIEIKDLKHKLDHSSCYTVLSPPCEACVSLKGKLLHATKENTELQQEVAYLTARLEKTILSEKMIEKDLSRVEESATKFTYRLGLDLRDVRRKVRRVLLSLFLAPATIKRRKHSNQPKHITHPIQSRPLTQIEKQGKKPLSRERKLLFACFVAVWVTWMSFVSRGRELRGGVLSMLETHIVMSLLIFRLALILVFRLAFTLVLLALSHVVCLALLLVFTSIRSWTQPSLIWFWSMREPL